VERLVQEPWQFPRAQLQPLEQELQQQQVLVLQVFQQQQEPPQLRLLPSLQARLQHVPEARLDGSDLLPKIHYKSDISLRSI
jgi:hypothetical protein